jgi:hypothetical protein
MPSQQYQEQIMSVRPFRQLLPLYIACYVAWLALSALGVWLSFALRPVLFGLAVWLRFNPWQVRALDNFSFVTFGLVWLIGILLLEHGLREGVENGRLWRRAAIVFVAEAAALGLCYVVQMLL